jgi:hypothetical protein
MNHSLKAALWSALVLPGLGQLLLKRYISGVLFALISITALAVILVKVFNIASSITQQIMETTAQLDMPAVIGAISQSTMISDTQTMNIAFVIFLVTWLVSTLDAYRIGDSMDKGTSEK